MQTATVEFETVLEAGGPSGRNIMVPVPADVDVKAVFGRANPPVTVELDDHPSFAGRLAVMGGRTVFGLTQSQVAAFGTTAGTTARVRLTLDTGTREVEVPVELAAAFADTPAARAAYDVLTASQRKEYATWVGGAKQQPTRDDRAAKAVVALLAGRRSPR